MPVGEKIKDARKWIVKKIDDNYIALIVIGVIMIVVGATIAATSGYFLRREQHQKSSGFLDYMPDVPRVCPSDYRCGGVSRAQTKMEHRLYADLREGSKYALPETMTTDAYDVIATEAEPTNCMIKRASVGTEAPMPEGQYTPWDEIESGFLSRNQKKMQASLTGL